MREIPRYSKLQSRANNNLLLLESHGDGRDRSHHLCAQAEGGPAGNRASVSGSHMPLSPSFALLVCDMPDAATASAPPWLPLLFSAMIVMQTGFAMLEVRGKTYVILTRLAFTVEVAFEGTYCARVHHVVTVLPPSDQALLVGLFTR